MPEYTTLMPIRTKGTKPPLFCIHGQPLRMAQNLPSDLPIYGVSHIYYSDSPDKSSDSIEKIAATYLSEIRQVQPNGPYNFCGFSAGGMIAYEMAKQLLNAGETIGGLTLVEPAIKTISDTAGVTQQMTQYLRKDSLPQLSRKLFIRAAKSITSKTRYFSIILATKFYFLFKI